MLQPSVTWPSTGSVIVSEAEVSSSWQGWQIGWDGVKKDDDPQITGVRACPIRETSRSPRECVEPSAHKVGNPHHPEVGDNHVHFGHERMSSR